MSAIQTEFPGIVRAVISEIGIVTGMAGSVTEAVRCRALWDTGAIYSVISKSLAVVQGGSRRELRGDR